MFEKQNGLEIFKTDKEKEVKMAKNPS